MLQISVKTLREELRNADIKGNQDLGQTADKHILPAFIPSILGAVDIVFVGENIIAGIPFFDANSFYPFANFTQYSFLFI